MERARTLVAPPPPLLLHASGGRRELEAGRGLREKTTGRGATAARSTAGARSRSVHPRGGDVRTGLRPGAERRVSPRRLGGMPLPKPQDDTNEGHGGAATAA